MSKMEVSWYNMKDTGFKEADGQIFVQEQGKGFDCCADSLLNPWRYYRKRGKRNEEMEEAAGGTAGNGNGADVCAGLWIESEGCSMGGL